MHKSKRQLIELVEQKDLEISEKNATFHGYLDKIVSFFWLQFSLSFRLRWHNFALTYFLMDLKVNLTDRAADREARISELEAELARSQATCARLSQVGFA